MKHPYEDARGFQLHRTAVSDRHPSLFDPVVAPKFKIGKQAAIATMGSCFAQHLSRRLLANGANFLRTESTSETAGGIFSANFGNVYTVAQAVQIHRHAFGERQPSSELWITAEGRFVDPLRPGPTAAGFHSRDEALQARREHFEGVRRMFQEAAVLVFTLGLTESWRRLSDGSILPVAPGVTAGRYSPVEYAFVNFEYDEVYTSLVEFVRRVANSNPRAKLILTVSPVPLAATFETRHVAVSSMESKSILRAAAGAVTRKHENVAYFPSFEIFFTPGIGGAYFQTDGRHVTEAGVSHAMRLFERHYLHESQAPIATNMIYSDSHSQKMRGEVWCDEDALS